MGAVLMCTRAALRRRVLATGAVAVLIALAGGIVFAALAGARRTETAYPRLLASLHTSDVAIIPHAFPAVDASTIARLPQVESAAPLVGFGITDRPENGGAPGDFSSYAATGPDGRMFFTRDQFSVVAGRMPRQDRAQEILVNQSLARRLGAHVGSTYRADLFNFAELRAAPDITSPTPEQIAHYFTPIDFTVVGIGRGPDEILQNQNQDGDALVLSPAFARQFASRASFSSIGVNLHDPRRDLSSFEAAVRARYPDVQVEFQSRAEKEATFARAVAPYADALRIFALVAAVTATLVIAQAAVRLVAADRRDDGVVQALGATRAQGAAIAAAPVAVAAVLGALGAAAVAVALSPLFPIGPARAAEPHPGVHLDVGVVVVGLIAVVALVVAIAAGAAWRQSGRRGAEARPDHPSGWAERLGRWGGSASAVTGVRGALRRDRRSGVSSVGATIFGLVAAVAMVGASLIFGASLGRLVTTPARYGWNWGVLIDTYEENASPALIQRASADHDLAALTVGWRGSVAVRGRAVQAFGFDAVRGRALPQIIEGRFPTGPDEIAVGAQTLRAAGASVGDTLPLRAADGSVHRLRVVGRTTLPALSLNGTLGLGEGVAMTAKSLAALDPQAQPSFFLADLRRSAHPTVVEHRYNDLATVLGPQRPFDITSYAGVRATPLFLAGLLALLGMGVLAHTLVSSIRNRRKELAVLKALGFVRRQTWSSVAWQATTLVSIALAVGLPLAIVAGRWIWRGFADDLGVGAGAVVPLTAIVVLPLATVVLANLIAAVPAHVAARTRPAVVLRSE